MKKYPFEAVVFTANVNFHTMPTADGYERAVKFALDLESTRFPRNPCIVDYNHDAKEPLGSATLERTRGAIVARGVLCSAFDGDRAFQVAAVGNETPFGISPTLDLADAVIEEIPEGSNGTANGVIYDGPVSIYRNAAVLGISICPYATDNATSLTPLNKGGVVTLNRTGVQLMNADYENNGEPIPVDDKTAEKLGDETGVSDGAAVVRDPELQAFIDEFGLEKGVDFFQGGLTLDEAKMEDYAQMKRLAKEAGAAEQEGGGGGGGGNGGKGALDSVDERIEEVMEKMARQFQAMLSRFNGAVQALARDRIAKLGAVDAPGSGDATPQKKTLREAIIAAAR